MSARAEPPDGSVASPLFRRVLAEHRFHKVAAAIREAVARGELQPGDQLPPQRELQQAFGVSRVTILEALRLLEADGLVEVQPGRNGGAVVLDASRHSLSRAVSLLLDTHHVDLAEVRELRTAIEVLAARLAAERATPEQIGFMENLLRRLDARARHPQPVRSGLVDTVTDDSYLALDLEFHTAVAAASQNRLLSALMEVFYHQLVGQAVPVDPAMQARLNASLHDVLERGIKAREPEAAAAAMAVHLAESFAVIQAAARPNSAGQQLP
jgi:GntR family transcriptional repressor for pyruvate dehydrogenase complex